MTDLLPPSERAEQIAVVLERAASELQRRGHSQEFLQRVDGRVCINGAIACACNIYDAEGRLCWPHRSELAMRAVKAVERSLELGGRGDAELNLAYWNDVEGRTPEEVRDALLAAAEAQRAPRPVGMFGRFPVNA